ncbi:MAG: hypothetical protein KDC09_17730, partial [Bacteroidales bacterium]|nr:hypothetical protein [Bacteroidales bacterium]
LDFYDRLGQLVAADPLTADLMTGGQWDADHFVDLCQQSVRKGGELREQCQWAQWLEWQVAVDAQSKAKS